MTDSRCNSFSKSIKIHAPLSRGSVELCRILNNHSRAFCVGLHQPINGFWRRNFVQPRSEASRAANLSRMADYALRGTWADRPTSLWKHRRLIGKTRAHFYILRDHLKHNQINSELKQNVKSYYRGPKWIVGDDLGRLPESLQGNYQVLFSEIINEVRLRGVMINDIITN